MHVEIALPVALQVLYALVLQAKHRAVLRTRGHFHIHTTFQRWHGELTAKRGHGISKRHVTVQVSAIALEEIVLLDADDHVQISGRTSFGARIAVSGGAQTRALLDSRGDLQA